MRNRGIGCGESLIIVVHNSSNSKNINQERLWHAEDRCGLKKRMSTRKVWRSDALLAKRARNKHGPRCQSATKEERHGRIGHNQ